MNDDLAARRARHGLALQANDGSWQCECGKNTALCRAELTDALAAAEHRNDQLWHRVFALECERNRLLAERERAHGA